MRNAQRWPRVLAVALVLVIVAASFGLSFTVLRDLAITVGIPAEVGWLWPVVVDGALTAATLVLYVDRKKWLPLVTLVVFGLASVIGNVAHIIMAQTEGASWAMPVFVGLMPPLGLLMTVELLSGLLKIEEPAAEVAQEADESAAVEAPALAATPVSVPAEPVVASVDASVETAFSTDTVPEESALREEALQEAVAEPVATSDTVDDGVADSAGAAHDAAAEDSEPAAERAERPVPVRQLHAVERLPESPAEQVDWIVRKARAGVDVSSWKDLSQLFEDAGLSMSGRTVQRRLAEAKKQEPELFEAVS